jgi:hypothetical protein
MNKADTKGISSSMMSPVPITTRAARGAMSTTTGDEEMELIRLGVPDSNGIAEFANGNEEEGDSLLGFEKKPSGLSTKDKQAAILLIILCWSLSFSYARPDALF